MRKVLTFVIISLIFFAGSAVAADEYIVQEGDTLWGISNEQIGDTFLWPKLWKANPEIGNPDLIYPGEKILIPTREELMRMFSDQVEEAPSVEVPSLPEPETVVELPAEEPEPPEYLIEKNLYTSIGWISAEIPGIGQITGSPTGRKMFGSNDIVYFEADRETNKDEKFLTVRTIKKLKHPITGKNMGYQTRVTGIIEVTGKDGDIPKSKIINSFEDINIGDRVVTYIETDPPFVPDNIRTPDMQGYIVESYMNNLMTSTQGIVYLDRGQVDGLEAGDIFSVFFEKPVKHSIGTIQVVSLQPATSTAIILESTKEIDVGSTWGKK